MKIRDVNTYRLEAALVEPFAYSQAWYERRGALLVEIVGDDGLSGWGEAFGPPSIRHPCAKGARGSRPALPVKSEMGMLALVSAGIRRMSGTTRLASPTHRKSG